METRRSDARATRWGRVFGSFFPMQSRVVRAEEAAPPSSPVETKPAEPPAPSPEEPAVQFEMIHREFQNISMQDNWDGFRIEAQKKVTDCLQATHSLFLGTRLRECGYLYQFGPAFQSPDGRTMLVARTGLDGGVTGRLIQKLGSSWELKGSSGSDLKDPQRNMYEGALEYSGPERAFGGKVAWQGYWLAGGSYVQKIMPQLQLGGDLTVVAVNSVTSVGQVGMRFTEGKHVFSAILTRALGGSASIMHELKMQYVRKVTERLSLGTEYKLSYPDKESGLTMAYEYLFRNARIQGLVDTDGKVSCSVSDISGFGFSGMIDYGRGDYKFGMLMHVLPEPAGGQPPQ
ncbi:TOM40-1 [Symbiodinium sp. CCMP2592]|nr:TOM40-1 [Symbiodinium sp. CCMP2592]CAE7462166.1 TOM40-1 [Symbiodinium sp. CCMP2456]